MPLLLSILDSGATRDCSAEDSTDRGNLTINLDHQSSAIDGLKWSVKVDEGRPGMSSVSCNLTKITLSSSNQNPIYSFEAQMKIVCLGIQVNNGAEIFQTRAEKCIGGSREGGDSTVNRVGDGGDFANQKSPTSCETLRLLLCATVAGSLISVASVMFCASVLVYRASRKSRARGRVVNRFGGQALPVGKIQQQQQQQQNPTLLTAVPPYLRASGKTCTYYEDPDVYSQIGSCLKSPYVNDA